MLRIGSPALPLILFLILILEYFLLQLQFTSPRNSYIISVCLLVLFHLSILLQSPFFWGGRRGGVGKQNMDCLNSYIYIFFDKLNSYILFQIDDARAAMLLYMKNRKQWEKSVKDQTRLEQKQKKRKPKKKPKLKDAAIVKAAVTASQQHLCSYIC